MQKVSELWKNLRQTPGTEVEYRFIINGTVYGSEAEVSHSADGKLFETFGIGNAHSASLRLELYAENIPRGAEIKRECRLVNGESVTDWLPKGAFFISSRSEEDGLWIIKASDAMRKAEKVWAPDNPNDFPISAKNFVAQVCELLEVELDDRSEIANIQLDYPANEQTWRQTLQYIAAASLGNFIITDENKLWLVPLLSAPEATSLLVDNYGNAVSFGGVRILV